MKKGIYRHYKGDFYRVTDIVYHHETGQANVVYNRCDKNGIFKSIRGLKLNNKGEQVEGIVNQPFIRDLNDFNSFVRVPYEDDPLVKRFKFIKEI